MGGVNISVDKNGLGVTGKSEDGNSVLIGHGYEVMGGATFNTDYLLYRLGDAEDLGITEANDKANKALVWYHISEYFRNAPGTKLWLRIVDGSSVLFKQIVDKDENHLKKILQNQIGQIRNVGVFLNKTAVQLDDAILLDGLDKDVWDAIPKAAELWEYERTLNRPLFEIFLEGHHFNGTPGSAGDLRASAATGVGVVIAQDLDVAAWDVVLKYHAGVGTALGIKAGKSVETNIGEVERNNLESKADGRWLNVGLSSNDALTTFNDDPTSGDFVILQDKGYIFPKTYQGTAGVFFNDDNSCDLATSDFYSLSNTAVYAKAHRGIYKNLVFEINKKILIDTETGKIAASDCARFENDGNEVVGATGYMTRAGEISGGKTFCDPDQDVLGTSNVAVGFSIVPVAYGRDINGTIHFAKKLN